MPFSQTQAIEAYKALESKQKPLLTFIGACIGCVPAAALFMLLSSLEGILVFLLLTPCILIGLLARLVGRSYHIKPRVPVGILGLVFYCAGVIALHLHPMLLMLAPCCFLIAISTAKVGLSRLERFALTQVELGYLSTSHNNPRR